MFTIWTIVAIVTMTTRQSDDKTNLFFYSHSLCNTIMFGVGPADDPRDGILLDEVIQEERKLAVSTDPVDKQ